MASGNKKPIVFVMMSGGVDSSVAAFLLREQGTYDVIGAFIKGYNVDGGQDKEAEDARHVAEQLGIPFRVVDLEQEYKQRVVAYLVDGYRKGITPNPDVMCNKEIKFGAFLDYARAQGADFVATGHYVRIQNSEFRIPGGDTTEVWSLQKGIDDNKDQSYFLWTLTQEQLRHCLFPIGDYAKQDIRAIAERAGLFTAQKKDSQGICFLGKVSLREFLEQYLPKRKGAIVTVDGVQVGEHDGAWFYTIGQRHGLHIGGGPAYFVVAKDVHANTLTVSHDDRLLAQARTSIDLTNVNGMGMYAVQRPASLPVLVRVRYRQPLFPAVLIATDTGIRLQFDTPQQFIAPGQSAVFYDAEGAIIGGGVIL